MTVTAKSSDNDYFLTDYFTTRMNFDGLSLKTTGSLEGYFEQDNVDSSLIIDDDARINRRREFCRSIIRDDGSLHNRYHIIMKLNIGLAMASKPLPKEVPLKLIFYRNTANKAIIQAKTETTIKPTLELTNPILQASFIESQYYDNKLSIRKIPRTRFPYIERTIRRELLQDGVDQFKIKLAEGKYFKLILFKNLHCFKGPCRLLWLLD